MILKILRAEYLDDYRLKVLLNNSVEGIVDLSSLLEVGRFSEFIDQDVFKDFKVDPDLGVIVWRNGLDVAPEYIQDRMDVLVG